MPLAIHLITAEVIRESPGGLWEPRSLSAPESFGSTQLGSLRFMLHPHNGGEMTQIGHNPDAYWASRPPLVVW